MDTKKTKAHLQGEQDFTKGISVDACPFDSDTAAKKQWLDAWYEARTKSRLPHIYEKYP